MTRSLPAAERTGREVGLVPGAPSLRGRRTAWAVLRRAAERPASEAQLAVTAGGVGAGGLGTGGVGTGGTGGEDGTGGTTATCPSTYENPIMWEDLPDLEVIRVDDTYYYTASTFHYSPGAPVLRSYDLVNWEYVGHSVPVLDMHASYDLERQSRVRQRDLGLDPPVPGEQRDLLLDGLHCSAGGGYAFTAKTRRGPWTKHSTQGATTTWAC